MNPRNRSTRRQVRPASASGPRQVRSSASGQTSSGRRGILSPSSPQGSGDVELCEAQILATLNGLEIEEASGFKMGVTNKTPEFLAKFPGGKVPALETPSGFCLTEGAAIMRFIADSGPKSCQLLGANPETRAIIAQWMFFTETELVASASLAFSMAAGYSTYDAALYDAKLLEYERALARLEKAVEGGKKFLVGNELTAADVAVVPALAMAMGVVLDAEMRKKVPGLVKYIDGIMEIPAVAKALPNPTRIETRKRPAAAA